MKKALAFFICTALIVSILVFTPSGAFADGEEPTPGASPTPTATATSRYALLSGIDSTVGTWNKEFVGNISSYVLTLDETQDSATVTPEKGDATQTVYINGKQADSVTVGVDNGKHKHLTIKVKQPDKRNRIYYVKVERKKSSNNDLASLSASAGTIDSEFDTTLLEYNIALDKYTPFITLTAAKAESHATLRIDGSRTTSRKYSIAPGAEKTVTITVRSQTGVTKTYSIHIKREEYPITNQTEALIDFAKHYLGTPYVRGAKGPDKFDCSGFVYYCLNGIGYSTGYRTSGAWAVSSFESITSIEEMLPGDILCFNGHVGIYMGDFMMIDCSSSHGGVRITSLGSPYWTENFICGKRVL